MAKSRNENLKKSDADKLQNNKKMILSLSDRNLFLIISYLGELSNLLSNYFAGNELTSQIDELSGHQSIIIESTGIKNRDDLQTLRLFKGDDSIVLCECIGLKDNINTTSYDTNTNQLIVFEPALLATKTISALFFVIDFQSFHDKCLGVRNLIETLTQLLGMPDQLKQPVFFIIINKPFHQSVQKIEEYLSTRLDDIIASRKNSNQKCELAWWELFKTHFFIIDILDRGEDRVSFYNNVLRKVVPTTQEVLKVESHKPKCESNLTKIEELNKEEASIIKSIDLLRTRLINITAERNQLLKTSNNDNFQDTGKPVAGILTNVGSFKIKKDSMEACIPGEEICLNEL